MVLPWHIKSIQANKVWDRYTGSDVSVHLFDTPPDPDHPALDLGRTPDAEPDGHGTATASLIGGRHVSSSESNYVGVATEVNIDAYGLYQMPADKAIDENFQNYDIAANSWGYVGRKFTPNFAEEDNWLLAERGLEDAAENGRDGLGTVMVWSSGNYGYPWQNEEVNMDNIKNSPYTIAVGAYDDEENITVWSEGGSALLISGPGNKVKAADEGSGYDYNSGTSFSSPLVSGTQALMLEANPDIGWRDAQEILVLSSDKDHFSKDKNATSLLNDEGLEFSHRYGFGTLNTHKAVNLAETWRQQSNSENLEKESYTSGFNKVITEDGVSDTITINNNWELDQVRINVGYSHDLPGELSYKLESPNGTESIYLDAPSYSDSEGKIDSEVDYENMWLTSNEFWGEESRGDWTLTVSDLHNDQERGYIDYWSIELWGDKETEDDEYYIDNNVNFMDVTDSKGQNTLNMSMYLEKGLTINTKTDLVDNSNMEVDFSEGSIYTFVGTENDDTFILNTFDDYVIDGFRGQDVLEYNLDTSSVSVSVSSRPDNQVLLDGNHFEHRAENIDEFVFEDDTFNYKDVLMENSKEVYYMENKRINDSFYAFEKEAQNAQQWGWEIVEKSYFHSPKNQNNSIDVFRFWNDEIGDHHYVTGEDEKNTLIEKNIGWDFEGKVFEAWENEQSHTNAIHRYWNPTKGDHLFTQDGPDDLQLMGYKYEGIAFYSDHFG